jgi:5-(carboxyamino)imidazole ribonucleotide synthase
MTQPRRFLPGATIGVMGGGQLGRMLAMAARPMGYRVHTFTPEPQSPAAQFSDRATVAEYHDEQAVRAFASEIDVLTFEFENIPAESIAWCAEHCEVRPHGAILHVAQNRLREKTFLAGKGLPVAPFRAVSGAEDLSRALEEIGAPAILKTAAFGYDGKGQQRISNRADLAAIQFPDEECVLEGVVDFEKELSVLIARDAEGATSVFPICENIHRNHILDFTIAPARVPRGVARAAAELGCAVAEGLDLIGLIAVEMFFCSDGALVINELAPRPHNSGHWTIEGCLTSQFQQQVRAVCGLPLGSTELLRPSAMANLLGDVWSAGEPHWASALASEGVSLHLYGKREPRPGRKMGHLTALAEDPDGALANVKAARESLTQSR